MNSVQVAVVQEGILYVDLDLSEIVRAKLDFDVVGHYARPDIFQLSISSAPQQTVTFTYPIHDTK